MKRYLPKTLFLRSVLILVTPVVLIHLISGYVFFERHWDYVSHLLSNNIVSEIGSLIRLEEKENVPMAHVQDIAKESHGIICTLSHDFPVSQAPEGMSGRILDDLLTENLSFPHAVHRTHHVLTIWVKTPQKVFHFEMPAKRLAHRTTLLFILWALGSSTLFLMIAAVVMHNQIRPLYRLARWSDTLEKNSSGPLVRIEGAREIRKIAMGIRTVVQQIRRNFEERTQMLLGISHDLRTPLTRIKLQLELMTPSADTKDIYQDVTQMIQMVNGYLVFARQEQEEEKTIELKEFLDDFICGIKDTRVDADIVLKRGALVLIRPIQFRRCLQNLMDNAQRYARDRIRLAVSFSEKNNTYVLTIEDDGVGIPKEFHDAVFHPFFRVDTSRHLEGESVGLGLSIVKNIVLSHNGHIRVDISSLGGALFEIILPLHQASPF